MSKRPDTPLVIIDIAVPRNIEPAVRRIANVFLYNIDDITRFSEKNLERRKCEISKAEQIVAEELKSFDTWRREYETRPVIKAMMNKAEAIRRSHLENTLKKLPSLNGEEKQKLEMMTKAIIRKMLKDPICNLKTNNGHDGHNYAEVVKQLFQLEVKDNIEE